MVEKQNNKLIVKPVWIFNTFTVFIIEKELDKSIDTVEVDLVDTQLVDTDALKFLYQLAVGGRQVIIKNPPKIMFDVLELLDIFDEFFKVVRLTRS
ncbi:MAG: hypothetical protein GXO22_02475 [Aquificae bacterium]|nr:hypothetical protein [Aquificota bacterium]